MANYKKLAELEGQQRVGRIKNFLFDYDDIMAELRAQITSSVSALESERAKNAGSEPRQLTFLKINSVNLERGDLTVEMKDENGVSDWFTIGTRQWVRK